MRDQKVVDKNQDNIVIKLNQWKGLNQQFLTNEILREWQEDVLNGYVDRIRILQARHGSGLYTHTEDEEIISMRRIDLPGGYSRVFVEFVDTSTHKVGFRICGDPTAQYPYDWGQVKDKDGVAVWLDFDSYPCRFQMYNNKIFITNGADKVYLYDRDVMFPLVPTIANSGFDEIFMRGKYICLFQNKIWLANTPEASYNIVKNLNYNITAGRDVYPDQYGAWEDVVPETFPEMVSIVGMLPLSKDLLGVWTKNGIYTIYCVNGVIQSVRKISDMICVEGDYLIPELPMAFDVKRRAWMWNGQTFKEMEEIKDIIWDKANNPFNCTEEVHSNTENEWNSGSHTAEGGITTANWIPNVLTMASDPTSTANEITGEKQEHNENNTGLFFRLASYGCSAQEFTCSAWDDDGNIPKAIKGVDLLIRGSVVGDQTIKVQLVEYDAYPDILGTGNMIGREVLAEWSKDITIAVGSGDVPQDENTWVRFSSTPEKIEATLTIGKIYFIEVTRVSGLMNSSTWLRNDNTTYDYPYGGAWYKAVPRLDFGDFCFRVIYTPTVDDVNVPIYESPEFYRPSVVGQTLSWAFADIPDTVAPSYIRVDFSTADSASDLWQTGYFSNDINNPYNLHHAGGSGGVDGKVLKNYFQYRIWLSGVPDNYTPLLYALKISYKIFSGGKLGGQIIATENQGKILLSLENETIIKTKQGTYRYENDLGITRPIDWGIGDSGTGIWCHCKEKLQGLVTSAANETFVFRDTDRTFVANELANWITEIVTGTGKGQIKTVTENTASDGNGDVTCTVATWTTNPPANSRYVLTNTKQWRYMSNGDTDGAILFKCKGTADTDTVDCLEHSTATFVTDNVAVNDYVYNITDGKKAQVSVIDSEIKLTLKTTGDGTDIFPDGDEKYRIETHSTDDIRLTLEYGMIDGEREGLSEYRKIFIGIRIWYESYYTEEIPFKLNWHTDRGTGSFTPDGAFDPGVAGAYRGLHLWEYSFKNEASRLGKYIVIDEISVPKKWVKGFKEIELVFQKVGEKRGKREQI